MNSVAALIAFAACFAVMGCFALHPALATVCGTLSGLFLAFALMRWAMGAPK